MGYGNNKGEWQFIPFKKGKGKGKSWMAWGSAHGGAAAGGNAWGRQGQGVGQGLGAQGNSAGGKGCAHGAGAGGKGKGGQGLRDGKGGGGDGALPQDRQGKPIRKKLICSECGGWRYKDLAEKECLVCGGQWKKLEGRRQGVPDEPQGADQGPGKKDEAQGGDAVEGNLNKLLSYIGNLFGEANLVEKLKEKNFDMDKARELVEGKEEEVVPKKSKAKRLGEARDRMSKADVAFSKAAKARQQAEKTEKELEEKLEKAKKDTAEKKEQHQLALNEKNEALCHNLEVEAEPDEEEEDDKNMELEPTGDGDDAPKDNGGLDLLAGKGGGPGTGRGRNSVKGGSSRAERSRTPPGGRGGGDVAAPAGPVFSFGFTKEQMDDMDQGMRSRFEQLHKDYETDAKKRKLDEDAAKAEEAAAAARAKKEEDERKAEEIKKKAEENAANNIRTGVQ